MNLLQLFKRNVLLFSYALIVWLGLTLLEVTLGFDGTLAGLVYWATLIILFLALWYANLPAVQSIRNETLRFCASIVLTTLIITIFLLAGIAIGASFKHVLSN